MRTVLIGVAMVISGILANQANAQSLAREFESPSGRNVLQLLNVPSRLGGSEPSEHALGKRMSEGEFVPAAYLCDSRLMSENHGLGWMNTDNYEWIDDKFLIFEDRYGVCVIDAEQNQVLLNQVFERYARAPNKTPFWAAIRTRPVGRHQEQLRGDEKDTLWFIEPESLVENRPASAEENLLKHIEGVLLDGIALAGPRWTRDSQGVVLAIQVNQQFEGTLFDAQTHEVKRIVPLAGLSLTREQLLLPGITPEVEEVVLKAIDDTGLLETLNTSSISPEERQPHVKLPLTAARSTASDSAESEPLLPGGDQSRSIGWAMVLLVTAGAIGLFWSFYKRRN